MRPGPFTSIHHSVHFTPPDPSSDACQHHPARALNATSHSLRVPRTSPARAQSTRGLRTHGAYGRPRANTLAAATRARTRRGPRPRPPLPTRVCGVCACTLPLAPARRSLMNNGLDEAAKQALEAAAGSGLDLRL